MTRSIHLLLVASLALSGCTNPDERFKAKDNIMFRVVAPECGYCKTFDYSSDGRKVTQVKLGSVLVRPIDIEYVARSGDKSDRIRFVFKQSAHTRILEASRDNRGKTIALVSGDRAVSLSVIAEPFSLGSEISGFTASESDYLMEQIVEKHYSP